MRITAFNTLKNAFEFFYIPAGEFDNSKNLVEIIIQRTILEQGVNPNFNGDYDTDKTFCKWYGYRADTFEEMCWMPYKVGTTELAVDIALPLQTKKPRAKPESDKPVKLKTPRKTKPKKVRTSQQKVVSPDQYSLF